MSIRPLLSIAVLAAAVLPIRASAEPAWGASCLSCHNLVQSNAIWVFGHDTLADPDESATGAPDRGTLKVFQSHVGASKSLQVEVLSLEVGDTYAVQLRRLRFAGVESGGHLVYGADCDWPEWGEPANYYTQPAGCYRWGSGPTVFSYEVQIEPASGYDYYDLVLAVAGKYFDSDELFYAEEHFYLQVVGLAGDLNCDGQVGFGDINWFALRLTNPVEYQAQFPNCPDSNGDINQDGTVGFADINPFVQLLSG